MIGGSRMHEDGSILFIATFIIFVLIVLFIIFHIIKKRRSAKYRAIIDNLEREKNLIASTPVPSELSN